MGRPRKSIEELQQSGAFRKDPQRLQKRLEVPAPPSGIGDPPDILKPPEKAVWIEVVGISAPGLLKSSDRLALIDLCRLWARYLKYGENITGGKSRGVNSRQMSRLNKLFSQFGMTPLDRGKIHVPHSPNKHNAFAKFNEFAEFDGDDEYAEFLPKPNPN